LAFAIGLLVGYAFWGRNASQNSVSAVNSEEASANDQAVAPQGTQQIKRYPVSMDDDPILGSENAPITIIEFSDFQCPYCEKWEKEVYGKLLQDYGDKIRFVYRDFPLTSIHPQAQPAAEAADCANEQGAFWKYHDKLFGMEYPLGADTYVKYASELGLDMDKFQQCLTERRYQAEVTADLEYATNLGVNSTPTFFINGIPLVGAQPYSVFKYVIDKELAGELPK
jgi:protein-disulfide isomerase